MPAHAGGEGGVGGFGAEPPQEIGEEIAGGDAGGEAVGEVQMGQQIHGDAGRDSG